MSNPFSLEGKTILITGASSGIGRAVAVECAKMGAAVIISGRNEERLRQTFSSLVGTGHKLIVADLSNEDGLKDLLGSLSGFDGIVLAAGVVEMIPVLFASKSKFDKILATNLFTPIELLRQVVKKKLFNPGLSVVAIDSVAGISKFEVANGIYGSGKAALASFLKYFALEMSGKKIRVNTVSPGMILTPMHTKGAVDEKKLQETIDRIPLKRWGKPEEVAYAVLYLLSDASAYLTGTNIKVDGGYTI